MFDPLDFDLFDPDTTIVRTLPWSTASASSPASSSYSNDDSSATLEREICTNFSCCGLVIPDMHDLLDHFEERHVLVSQDAFPASFPAVERNLAPLRGTPLVVSFPRPMTPPARRALPALTHSPSSASDSDASLVSPVDSFLPDSSPPMPSRALPPTSFSHDKRHSPSNATNRERGAGGRFKPRPSTSTVSAATAGGTRSALDLSVSRRRDRERERQFRCPKPGCVKSYLNPNGLKYHLDKGTCKLIGEHSPA